ncbi:Nif3-like dinuclear metal center hexameric protein [Gaoshiqia sediminis]|uniref:GTP cyclohydrolase 1 type 2 homolog n=1 Tax=Gaoshiqia sediminis TaxID=2986998 RepID=A0AA42C8H1_9BACT|nr:Nif3-like dinuclear metal center hexameric protein [Gaoshiqia sediminis]MCW0481202.1 Nif3-like dinuclear metal center hexameric protein [Gaoshiqia sediminis]
MQISEITSFIESIAPLAYQESYDNAGLLVGAPTDEADSALITLDVTEAVVDEAIAGGFKLIIAHHPLIFGGIKKLNGKTELERCLIKAIKNDVAIYAAHTNLDSVMGGVNSKICEKLGLINCKILSPIKGQLKKLVTYIPTDQAEKVQQAVFEAGAGHVGNYDSCGYTLEGIGSFRGNENSKPFVGEKGNFHTEKETRFETIFPAHLQGKIIQALLANHPYEEVAYDIHPLDNESPLAGMGMIGELAEPMDEMEFLQFTKNEFQSSVIRHSPLLHKKVKKVAVCGGSGSFLIRQAIGSKATVFITGDLKYHQFFEAEGKIVLADIGHFESEQFTKEVFYELLTKKFPKFAIRLSAINTNPINYLI